MIGMTLLDRGVVPDALVRFGIRRLLKQRLREEDRGSPEANQQAVLDWIDGLRDSPIAIQTEAANEQHYEVPGAFFEQVLGKHLKYSSGHWGDGVNDLDAAETAMLELYIERAELRDGMRVLDLGCGWGSLSLFVAARFPNSQVVGVSNSASQREFIMARAAARGLDNVEIITCDVNDLELTGPFDRVLSIEMFEHLRNYGEIMRRIAGMLSDEGKLFIHIFVHREHAYPFDTAGDDNWMGRYFFSGGQMPSDHLLLYFQVHLELCSHWRVSGEHYAKTSEAWLERFDANRASIDPVLASTYGTDARRMRSYWRVFFMACAELWKYRRGTEWFVSHYLFSKRRLEV
jgi:cyclopropane-fatty-acyl-phospholipid synthase